MSYEEANYMKEKHKQQGLEKMQQKEKRLKELGKYLPDNVTKVASDNPTFTRKHYNSMYEAMKKVNPKKWR